MQINILGEYGYEHILDAIGLSYKAKPDEQVLMNLNKKKNLYTGAAKHLEYIDIYFTVRAPLYWWKHFDTYRIGVLPYKDPEYSESTMHTILQHKLLQSDFAAEILPSYLDYLNKLIEAKRFKEVVNGLPGGFLQERLLKLNYKSLANIIINRRNHKLEEWRFFCDYMLKNTEHNYLLNSLLEN